MRDDVQNKEPEVNEKTQAAESVGELIDIAMPKMGESVMEGTIIKWHKKVGEKVQKDETMFEISTDKVDTEVPSPAEGTIAEILVAEQETVEVGTIVARLSTGATSQKVIPRKEDKPEATKSEKPFKEKIEIPQQMHEVFSAGTAQRAETIEGENSGFYSPLVLNIARKEQVSFDELAKIKGSGLEGRLTKKDILSYVESRGVKIETSSRATLNQQPAEKENR